MPKLAGAGQRVGNRQARRYACVDAMGALSIDEAVAALKRDPAHPVRAAVAGMVVELRAVTEAAGPTAGTVADVLDEIGRWEGESGAALDALFAGVRQRMNRRVPDLP